MIYFLTAIFAMIFWGVGDFFIQKTVRKIGDIPTIAWGGLIGALILTPFVITDLKQLANPETLWPLLILGLVTFVASAVIFKSLGDGKLSVVEIVLTLELPLSVIIGIIVFQEQLSIPQFLLIIFAFAGVILVSKSHQSGLKKIIELFTGKSRFWEKGVLLAGLAAILSAGMNFSATLAARQASPVLAIWFAWALCAIIAFSFVVFSGQIAKLWRQSRNIKSLIWWMSFFDVGAWLLFALVVVQKELSLTIAITECYPAVSIILANRFNDEKVHSHQLIGIVIALIASFLLGLTY